MNRFFINIAGINILIEGNSTIIRLIVKELNAKRFNGESYNIKIEESMNLRKDYNPVIYTAKGNMDFNRYSYFMGYNENVKYVVSNLFIKSDITNIKFSVKKKSFNIKNLIKRIYQVSDEENNKNIVLSYSLFLYVLHVVLLKNKKSFLHSGVFSKNNNATIFVGTSGCGKTSTVFKLLEDENYNYLSDDYGIIDSSGYTYYNPKSISIYSSDIEFGQKILMKYFSNLDIKTKVKWYIQKNILKRNPMIKVSPKEVIGQRISEKSKIKNVLYFIRNNEKDIKIKDLSINELCERASDASMRELKSLNEVILLIRANAPLDYNIPSFEDIRKETKEIYKKAFEKTNNKIVYIPHKTKPEELVLFLKNEGLI